MSYTSNLKYKQYFQNEIQYNYVKPTHTQNPSSQFPFNYQPSQYAPKSNMIQNLQTQQYTQDYSQNLRNPQIFKIDYSKDPTESMIKQAHESLKLLKSRRPTSRPKFQDVLEQNVMPSKPQMIIKKDQQNQKREQGQLNTAPQFKQRQQRPVDVPQGDDRPAYIQKQSQPNIPNVGPQTLYTCSEGCGRKFAQEALEKHENVCKKVFQQKRKQFDTAAQRLVSKEQVQLLKQNQKNQQKQQKPQGKVPKWKLQSQAFRAILKQNNGATQLTVQEQKNLKDVMDEAAGLQGCEYCGRKFNEKAWQRHVPFCKEKKQKDQFKQPIQKRK